MDKEEINHIIEGFINEFNKDKEPIRINFRKLVHELNNSERYTHLIHTYPAKLLSNIPYFFLKTDYFCPYNGVVLDPFCGTGTVMLEANISGRNAKGADANPLATLISEVKTTYIPKEDLEDTLSSIIDKLKKRSYNKVTYDVSIERWFPISTIKKLDRLENIINDIENLSYKNFFMICFSSLIKKVSYADPCISVPVKMNPYKFVENVKRRNYTIQKLIEIERIDVFDKFYQICKLNIQRIDTLKEIYSSGISTKIISNDARVLTENIGSNEKLGDESIDFILTSPPYAGAQKYIRSSWLNLYWLGTKNGEDIRSLKRKNIGREDYHKSDIHFIKTGIESADLVLNSLFNEGKKERAFIVGNYLIEMKEALDEAIRVLKKNGYMVIVIGNNKVCGRPFNTQEYITNYIISKGLQLKFKLIDDIKSYGLMTKRNKTASRISCEWVLVFKK